MRRFANLFIIMYLFDALLSLADELLQLGSLPLPLFSEVRFGLATLVIVLSAVIYACLGFDRRLPKRVFVPLTLYVSWCTVDLWPLAGFIGREGLGLLASVGQLLLCGGALLVLRRMGGSALLSGVLFRAKAFSWRNTLGFSAVNLLLSPLLLLYSGLAVAAYSLDQQTAGFMRLSPFGIYMSERSYHREAKLVRLAAMMHVGREDYFRELAASMASGGTVVLAEGVSDQDGLLKDQFDYSRLADILGLTSQDVMRLDGRMVELEDLDALTPGVGGPGKPDIVRADIDLNRFDPQTVDFLNVLGRTLFGDKPLAEGLLEYNQWAAEQMTPERIAGVMGDILDKRNAVVIDGMVRSLRRYDTVIIPWGALHMPAIEAAVLEQGFVPGAVHERLSLDFRTIPYAGLWRQWTAGRGEGANSTALPSTDR